MSARQHWVPLCAPMRLARCCCCSVPRACERLANRGPAEYPGPVGAALAAQPEQVAGVVRQRDLPAASSCVVIGIALSHELYRKDSGRSFPPLVVRVGTQPEVA